MPRTVAEAFGEFLASLTPTATESEAAKNHRASIVQCLSTTFGLENFFRSGSFGNGTSIAGFSDVDYFAVFPRDILTEDSTYSLRKIRTRLERRFPHSDVRVSNPAIVVPFGSDDSESTEIVVADYIGDTRSRNAIFDIPDGSGGWRASSPGEHKNYVRSLDRRLDGRLKALIRLAKAWKYYCNVPISSFYLELRTAEYAKGEDWLSFEYDLPLLFRHLWDKRLASMRDPCGVSGRIVATGSDHQLNDALSKLGTAYGRASKAALALGRGNERQAFAWWSMLFAGAFPGYYR